MRVRGKVLVTLVAMSIAISAAGAQVDSRADPPACVDSAAVGMYRRCALWVDGGRIKRGEEGLTIARPGMFHPLRLTEIVIGDSAQTYARRFEHRAGQAGAVGLVGTALIVVGYYVLDHRECQPGFYGGCDYRDNGDWVGGSLLAGGLGFTLAASAFQAKATRARALAVWWHNARFSR